jgi:LysM repeat protein
MSTPLSEETAQKLLAQGSGGNSSPASVGAVPNTSGFAKGLKDVTEGALSVAAGFTRLNSGTDAATAGLNALSAGAKTVGFGALGKGMDLFGGALLQQKQNLDKASAELGIGGNNIGLFVRMAGDAGLTTQQFTEVIKRADGSIGGLGITAQQSAINFSKIQKNIVETGDQLNKMGISAQEQADITAMATMNDAKRDASTKAGQAAIAKSAIDLAMNLDETAKITGQSRQAIMDSIKAEEKKPLAAIAMLQMDEKQRENYTQLQAQVQKLGPGFMSLSTEIATGGVQTKEGLAMLQAMGPEAANKYQAASQAMIDARTPEEKKRAQALMDEAQAAVQRRMADDEFKRMIKSGTAEQQAAASNLVSGNKAMMSVQSEVQKNGGDYAKAIKDQREAVQATQAGLKTDETTGKVKKDDQGNAIADEGQKVAQDLNGLNKAAALAAGGFAHSVEDANKSMAKTPAYVDAMNKAMQTISGGAKTIEGAQASQKGKIEKGLNEIAGAAGGDGPTKTQKGAASLPKDYSPTAKTKLAEGGIVEPKPGGTDVNVGEAGKAEAVVPLDKLDGMLAKSPSATATAISTVPAATGAKVEPATKAVEAPAPVSDDQKKIVDEFKNASNDTITMFANSAKRGMNEVSKNITEGEERISNIRKRAADQGRDLTESEQNRIGHVQEGIATNKKLLDEEKTRFETLSNFENVKKQIAQEGSAKAIEAKKSEVTEAVKGEEVKKTLTASQMAHHAFATMGMTENQKKMFGEFYTLSKEDSDKKKQSLAEEEVSARAANKAAFSARDAIEEKAELEGRKLTESEQAQYESLTAEMSASVKRIDIARDAQKVLEKSDEEKAMSAKIAAGEEENAKEIAAFRAMQIAAKGAQDQENIQTAALAKTKTNVNETLTINGKVVDPNSAEGKAALGKMEEAKAKMNQVMGGMMPDMDKMMAAGGKMTVNGKEVDPNSKEGQGAMASMKDSMKSMLPDIKSPEFRSILMHGTPEQRKAAEAKVEAETKTPKTEEAKVKSDDKAKTESHTIKAGETLSKIAKEAGVSVQDIMKANPNIKDPNKIAAGASLNIPGVKKAEEAKPKATEEKKPEADTAKKAEEAKKAEAPKPTEQTKKPGEVGYVSEQANKLTSGFGNIGAGNDMFNPKVVNKISDEEWAKIKEKQKSESAPKATTAQSAPKTSDAAPKKEEPKKEEPKKAEPAKTTTETTKPKTAETTLKDLNDQMIMLNRHMVELIKHSSTTADASNKTAKSAAKSTGRAF